MRSIDSGKPAGGYPDKYGDVVGGTPGLKVPNGRSLIAGSEDDVKIFGVNAVFEDAADEGVCGVERSVLSGVVRSGSEAGVLRSAPLGEALGDELL